MNLRILALLFFLPLWVRAADEDATIEARLTEYYDSISKKAIGLAVSYYHPNSANLDKAQAEFETFTKQFDLSYKITEFKLVGEVDGDVVVAFDESTTFSKVGGEPINTFNAKVLMVWRKDDKGIFRIWDSLALKFAEAENKPKTESEDAPSNR